MNEKSNPPRPSTSSGTLHRSNSGIRITKQSAIKERKRQVLERELEFVDMITRTNPIQHNLPLPTQAAFNGTATMKGIPRIGSMKKKAPLGLV